MALIRRAEGGGWVVARDLGSVSTGDLFRAGGYRLPQDALTLQRAAVGLAPGARVSLQRAEAALRENLAVSLRELFSTPSTVGDARSEEHP